MCCIYMCILSVELVHAIHSCSSSIPSEIVVVSTFVRSAACACSYRPIRQSVTVEVLPRLTKVL